MLFPLFSVTEVYVNKNKSRETRQDIRAKIQLRNDDSLNQVGLISTGCALKVRATGSATMQSRGEKEKGQGQCQDFSCKSTKR